MVARRVRFPATLEPGNVPVMIPRRSAGESDREMHDILVNWDGGTVALLWPATDAGTEWCRNNLEPDAFRYGCSYVIEPRHLGYILDGIEADGLGVARGETY